MTVASALGKKRRGEHAQNPAFFARMKTERGIAMKKMILLFLSLLLLLTSCVRSPGETGTAAGETGRAPAVTGSETETGEETENREGTPARAGKGIKERSLSLASLDSSLYAREPFYTAGLTDCVSPAGGSPSSGFAFGKTTFPRGEG